MMKIDPKPIRFTYVTEDAAYVEEDSLELFKAALKEVAIALAEQEGLDPDVFIKRLQAKGSLPDDEPEEES